MQTPTLTIKFISKNPPYMAGDVATFPEEVAKRYLNAGLAERHKLANPPGRKQLKPEESKEYVTK